MDAQTFELLYAINAEGLENSEQGFCENINSTKEYFGTVEDVELKGQFVYVYFSDYKIYSFITDIKLQPTFILHVDEYELLFYKL